jgi:hypothetical protein
VSLEFIPVSRMRQRCASAMSDMPGELCSPITSVLRAKLDMFISNVNDQIRERQYSLLSIRCESVKSEEDVPCSSGSITAWDEFFVPSFDVKPRLVSRTPSILSC